jgi:hypothetical protein
LTAALFATIRKRLTLFNEMVKQKLWVWEGSSQANSSGEAHLHRRCYLLLLIAGGRIELPTSGL